MVCLELFLLKHRKHPKTHPPFSGAFRCRSSARLLLSPQHRPPGSGETSSAFRYSLVVRPSEDAGNTINNKCNFKGTGEVEARRHGWSCRDGSSGQRSASSHAQGPWRQGLAHTRPQSSGTELA